MKYVLDIPWGFKHPDIKYYKDKKIYVYQKNALLPPELRPFAVPDYSYGRWQEDEENGIVQTPEVSENQFKPRDYQVEAAKKIIKSYANNYPGFLLADKTGTGKTLSSIVAITNLARLNNFGSRNKAKVLIVCTKGAIPVWRQTLHAYKQSSAYIRPLIINYQQLNKLLSQPANAKVSKKRSTKNKQTARNGKPTVNWDYIIFDEAHYLKNYPKSTMSLAAAAIAGLNTPYIKSKSPFVLYCTATPGSTPLNFSIMANWLSKLLNPKSQNITPSMWGDFLIKEGFSITKGKTGYMWVRLPNINTDKKSPREVAAAKAEYAKVQRLQRKDAQRIGKALTSKDAPFIMRSPSDIAGWPEQQYIALPIELEGKSRIAYEEVWSVFRRWLNLPTSRKDSKSRLIETLRYKQKSSLLKVEPMIEQIIDFVENDNQIYISVDFIETLDAYKQKLIAKGIKVSEISGRNVNERELERIKFQKGITKVVLCTVPESISLHANEILADGTKATSATRITIIHDLKKDPNATIQSFGRAHRSGENSNVYFPYFEKTVEEKIINIFTNNSGNLETMLGSSNDEADFMDKIFSEAAARTTPPNRRS